MKPRRATSRLAKHASLAVLALIFLGGIRAAGAAPDDGPCAEYLQTIQKRLRTRQLEGVGDGTALRAKRYTKDLRDDGSWAGIDYSDRSRARWKPSAHLRRLVTMARAHESPQSPVHGNADLKKALVKAFHHWVDSDYQSANWWWNVIWTPWKLADVMVLMEDEIPPADLQKGLKIARRAWPEADRRYMTGANLVWRARTAVKRACLEGNCQLLETAASAMDDTAKITGGEGIQVDFSFHQHGPQLYSGSYGMAFTGDWAAMASLVRGTRFAFDEKHVKNFCGYLLDGQRWMVRDGLFDYTPCGRAVTRKGGTGTGTLREAALHLMKLDTPRQDELAEFARKLKDGSLDPGEGPRGNRSFWRSDFMVHRRKAFYASVNVTSKRTRGAEVVNEEGIKSYHLPHGCNYLLMDADEYRHIFPVWDWERVPGVTCEQTDRDLPRPGGLGTTDFAGGVSDGQYGAEAFVYHDRNKPGHAKARKSWFFFDRIYVCLGAGIRCESDNPVYTSVNQCRLDGDVLVTGEGERSTVKQGQNRSGALRWVHHDGVTYAFPGSQEVHVSTETQSGSWWEINHPSPKKKVSMPVFSLWVDHGKRPEGANYSYVVMPGKKQKEASSAADDLPVRIVDNTPALQAVYHWELGISQMVFYEAGKVQLPEGLEVTVDTPCMVVLREIPGGLSVAVSSPQHRADKIRVTLNKKLSGPDCAWNADRGVSVIDVDLPIGLRAGQSFVRNLNRPD